ncbi:MAG: hypothetical protein HXY30_10795 [Pseudorhodoplanes sp.]|nr:hypothetical protein [Pseudorhodoplanes sp.]
MADQRGSAHFPRPAPIEAYGKGGFRFAGMSHRGSLLCLPSGIWAWSAMRPQDIDEAALDPVFREAADIGFFLLGTGQTGVALSAGLRARFQAAGIAYEVMRTGQAAHTYNLLLGEGRRVAAALIAVD